MLPRPHLLSQPNPRLSFWLWHPTSKHPGSNLTQSATKHPSDNTGEKQPTSAMLTSCHTNLYKHNLRIFRVKWGPCFYKTLNPRDVCLCQGECIYQSLCESFEQFMLWGWKEQDVSSPNYKLLLLHRRSLTKLVEQKVITKKSFSFILKID